MSLKDDLLAELDQLVAEGQRLNGTYQMSGGSRESAVPEVEFQSFAISARASITRIGGKESEFCKALPTKFPEQMAVLGFGGSVVPVITGALISLRKAVDAGWLVSLEA